MVQQQLGVKKWRKGLAIAGAVGFVIAVIAVTIALLIGPGPENPGNSGSSGRTADGESSPAPVHGQDEEASAETAAETAAAVKLDRGGFAVMEVTTDPRVAAASAAQVLMSADTSKIEWVEDFREEVLARVMRPSPDYVGAGAGISVTDARGNTLTGDDLIEQAPEMLAQMTYSPEGWWWLLGDARNFAGYQSYGAKLTSRAVEVYDQAEMAEYSGGASWTEPSSMLTVDVAPDAFFGLYWVRVATTTTTGDGESTVRHPVALAIYCDPPANGGICGVAATMTKYPSGWKTSY